MKVQELFEKWVRSEYYWSITWEQDGTPYVNGEGLSQQAECDAAWAAFNQGYIEGRIAIRD